MATKEKTKTAAKDKAKPAAKEKAPKAPGVGAIACNLLENGDAKHSATDGQPKTFMTNQEVLDEVLKQFPQANTKTASINWYRNDLRTKGKKVPQNRAIVKDRKVGDVKDTAKKGAKAAAKKSVGKKGAAGNLV